MKIDQLKPNIIVQGPIFPEPVKIITTIAMGDSVKLIGKGMDTGKVHESIVKIEQYLVGPDKILSSAESTEKNE